MLFLTLISEISMLHFLQVGHGAHCRPAHLLKQDYPPTPPTQEYPAIPHPASLLQGNPSHSPVLTPALNRATQLFGAEVSYLQIGLFELLQELREVCPFSQYGSEKMR